jgi:CheY-like chemotaxis protein
MVAGIVRVLVVDDEPGFRNVIARMLERLGFSALVAEDGVKGLELVERENPSLVVLDQRMPGLTGVEVAKELHRRGCRVPIVLVSGAGDVEDLAREAGITFWASKPIGRTELLGLLRRVGLVDGPDDPRAQPI